MVFKHIRRVWEIGFCGFQKLAYVALLRGEIIACGIMAYLPLVDLVAKALPDASICQVIPLQ